MAYQKFTGEEFIDTELAPKLNDNFDAVKKYVDDSIANGDVNSAKYLNITNFIPSNSDFNDYKTPGEYQVQSHMEANTIANLPTSYNDASPRSGVLSVLIGFSAPRTSLVQIYRTYGSSYVASRTYQRCFYHENSSWTAWREIACTDEVGLLNQANTYTALNIFRANIGVSNGTAAGSSGTVSFGVSPTGETVQARIGTDNLGGLFYHASTNQSHVFRIGTNNNVFAIRDDNTKVAFSSNNNFFATVTHDGVAKWLGNANTATKLQTARTINGVSFDGTANITIADSTKLPIAGGTMTGDLTLKGNPTADLMAATKKYVDDSVASAGGGDVNSAKYLNITNFIPSNSDFNDYKTPGEYQVQSHMEANTIANLPTSYNDASPRSGVLSVLIGFSAPRTSLVQIYRTYGSSYVASRTYQRCFYHENSSWTAWREIACTDEVGLLNQANTYTALNIFRANIGVSNGTAAGSSGTVSFGVSPTGETVQARIGTDNLGGLFYHASTNQSHVFRIGTNNNVFAIRDDNTKVAFSSNNNFFATVTHDGVAKWLGNANTATKLATARTITANLASSTAGSFDGSANITVGVTGTLPIANGGTGLTSAPSMLVNLASTTATSPLQASPRPGVTGTLPIANGGTGQTTAAGVRNALGLGNTTGAVPIANGGTGATTAAAARTALGCAPAYTYSTTDLTAGSSKLTTGTLYIVYE